jgi:deoxyribose-phosphate aldolase
LYTPISALQKDGMEEFDDEVKYFDYCNRVDLHALDYHSNLNSVVSIASEHGFRGIVVTPTRLEQLITAIKNYGEKSLVPICAIDFPLGCMSLDVRNYSIMSAKEKGAREVEIVAPYHLISQRDFKKTYQDAQNIVATTKKAGVSLKYVLDQNSPYIDDSIRTKLCRIIDTSKIPIVSTSLGFFDKTIDHADHILKMRGIKSKAGCDLKVFVRSDNPKDIASYVKAGADIVGLKWETAPYLVHAYEKMVQEG